MMCPLSVTMAAEVRRRLSRGSVDRETGLLLPIIGTPCEVPVPKNINFMACVAFSPFSVPVFSLSLYLSILPGHSRRPLFLSLPLRFLPP